LDAALHQYGFEQRLLFFRSVLDEFCVALMLCEVAAKLNAEMLKASSFAGTAEDWDSGK